MKNKKKNQGHCYGLFYYDKGMWRGPAYAETFREKNEELRAAVGSVLKKRTRYGKLTWSLN